MALSSAGFSIAGVNSSGVAILNLKASSTVPLYLVEVGIFVSVVPATAFDLSLIRMNAVGTGTITSTAGATHTSGGTATAVLETAWATLRPTTTGSHFRRILLPLTIGAGVIWPLGEGIMAPAAGGICLLLNTANGATLGNIVGYFAWDE